MDSIVVEGGVKLAGKVEISGAKNAALPILCTSILATGKNVYRNVPHLRDIRTTRKLLAQMGLTSEGHDNVVEIINDGKVDPVAPYELVKQMRASVLVLGPLAARFGKARVSLPGGCAIGARPIDQHLKGLKAMGARIELEQGYVALDVPAGRLRGAEFSFDMVTVTGTENLMAAATLARGTTTLINAAREPEIGDLAEMLNRMGAKISGAGTDVIQIEGVDELGPADHDILPDRIEAGTYAVAAVLTRGDIVLKNARYQDLEALFVKLRAAGASVEQRGSVDIAVSHRGPIKSVDVSTAPHPGFPTDMQAQFMVLMALSQGTATITETIFENRYMHVPELNRMGANIEVHGRVATVRGVETLQSAPVMATDLRASASLVLAGLVAKGKTEVRRIYHLDRGYERIEEKLGGLGAKIERVRGDL